MTRPIGPDKGRSSGGQIAYLIEQVGKDWHWKVYTATRALAVGVERTYKEAEEAARQAGPRSKEKE